ncbi:MULTISPECIES: c-type cytochrome [Alteromonadaceae]|uniref:c-type cytochrome n=1 Tax=Alteromonadaceae TaxID=72275 RepID=UPI001C0A580F|nr:MULTISPECIES: c-type cytochrome [Aliiglaciecola]MBU2876484.1 cytochrome c4 [Aliiglaciecola lipolytica]MDO6713052.1 c-type cytochrome [Aliiglaciecola sp. 2_MG-2023]MDO6754091.1 c-type cytochrome [Aliiglaciecola sp. 1_MG-2023]
MKKLGLLVCLTVGFSASVFAKGDAQAGEGLVTSKGCVACHGADGNSPLDIYPSIAGQHAEYIAKQLKELKLGGETAGAEGRYDPVMSSQAALLNEQEMLDLAAYFATQEAKPGTTPEDVVEKGGELYRGGDLERGITACIACHGPRGNGLGLAGFPDISGQKAAYLKSQLEKFKAGSRANDLNGMMRDIAAKLTDEDIETLSQYLGGLH